MSNYSALNYDPFGFLGPVRNGSARITEVGSRRARFSVKTSNRDLGSLEATARVRRRNDVTSGRSLTGLSLRTRGGRQIRLTGHEARTLLRVLSRAAG